MSAASGRIRRLRRIDRAAVAVITLGGIAVVVSVVGILAFIAAEALPLFKPSSATLLGTLRPEAVATGVPGGTALGSDESNRHVYQVTTDGRFVFRHPESGATTMEVMPSSLAGTPGTVVAASRSLLGDFVALAAGDGRVVLTQVRFLPVYQDSTLSDVKIEVRERGVVRFDLTSRPAGRVAYLEEGDLKVVAGQLSPTEIGVWWSPAEGVEQRASVSIGTDERVTAVDVGRTGTVIAGTDRGRVYHWELGDAAVLTDMSPVGDSPITALAYMIGNRTFVAGTQDGKVSAWFRAPAGPHDELAMVRASDFDRHEGAIISIAPSTRDRTFAAADATGRIVLRHQTSGRRVLEISAPAAATHLVMTPRSDGLLAVRGSTGIDRYAVANPHPEVSWRTLFGKTWYEGYAQPEYVWQSTAATDDFEPKFSLVPLVFGTIKGTIYALLFAIPLAVLGALYTSQFAHSSLRAKIKPTIEIMAALPSVVIGFVAGLYLAPMVERHLMAVGLMLILLPLSGTSGLLVWSILPAAVTRRFRVGAELAIILPMLVLGGWLAYRIAPGVENALFDGDARQWLSTMLGVTYDQRNSLVIGLAMGFAVIPIIFTISEDAFSSVPSNLSAASLALGASRWQTAVRVIVPTASPGVFSAIMVGFGRAVGETMIVLMATGNTPVMDWSIFNGFRTLSANIAVEIPEAPHGGTLYRTLFLSAGLLFVMTFTLNTVAEVIRQRLRDRYRAI